MKKTSFFTSLLLIAVAVMGISCEPNNPEESNEIKIEKVLINAANASFIMGSPETEEGHFADERQHKVSFTKNFYMSTYEITNAQYAKYLNITGYRPTDSFTIGEGENKLTYVYVKENDTCGVYFNYNLAKWVPADNMDNNPAVHITWFGAKAFAEYVGGDLPTEAQWEFACRAGTTTAFSFGDDVALFDEYGVYENNCEGNHASAVGTKKPNAWGLYDMHGNANEWCLDLWDMLSEWPEEDLVDPVSPTPGGFNLIRGGSWFSSALYCRSAVRIVGQPDYATDDSGFRVVFPAE